MKLKIKLEREGLYFLLVVLLIGIVIATGGDNPAVFHDVLYTDHIKPHYLLTRMEVNAASGTSNPFFFLVNYNGDEVAAVTMGFDGNRNVIVKHNLAVEGELCDYRDMTNCVDVTDLINLVDSGGAGPFTLTVDPTSHGSITGSGINCGEGITEASVCSKTFNSGTQVTLTATALTGYMFTGWTNSLYSELCSGIPTTANGACTLTMSSNPVVVTAIFTQQGQVATPTFNPDPNPIIPLIYNSPINIIITSTTPNAIIKYTTNGNEPTSSSTLYTTPIPISTTTTLKAKAWKTGMNPSVTASATYAINPNFKTLTVTKSGSGTVTFNPPTGGYTCTPTCSRTYLSGTQVTLTATASSGYTFSHWGEICSSTPTNPICIFNIYSNTNVNVVFISATQIKPVGTIFVTSQKWDGNLNGITGANAKCQQAAVNLGGTWIAIISQLGNNFKNTLTNYGYDGHFYRIDGNSIASSKNDLFDGSINAPINIDEFGQTPTGVVTVWTGTNSSGHYCGSNPLINPLIVNGGSCEGWTENEGEVYNFFMGGNSDGNIGCIGGQNANDEGWMYINTAWCNKEKRLYCLKISDTPPIIPPIQPYLLTVSKTGSGTVTSSDGGINCGTGTLNDCTEPYPLNTQVTLTALPSSNYGVSWGVGVCTILNPDQCSVTMGSSKLVNVYFNNNQYKLIVLKAGTGDGTVTSSPLGVPSSGINCGDMCSAYFSDTQQVILTASASSGSTFTGWTGCLASQSPHTNQCVLTTNFAKTITATFFG